MRPTFCIATFGCKANQYDSQLIRERLLAAGWEERPRTAEPDVAIVNTCTVTHTADAKARRLIRRLARELPRCRIVVTGCMVVRDPALFDGMPGVCRVVPNEGKPEIAALLSSHVEEPPAGRSAESDRPSPTQRRAHISPRQAPRTTDAGPAEGVRLSGQADTCPHPAAATKPTGSGPGEVGAERSPTRAWPEGISDFAGHTRAFVKVQEGCDAWCAYCIIPAVRGPPRSRPIDQAVAEAGRLAERFKEIVLTGIHVGRYRDASGADLAALVRAVLNETSVERLRISSIEVNELTPGLLDLAAGSDRVCPHFHLPLQSGSDQVLERMERRYTAGEFLETVSRIREFLDRPAITTDVIVGFPGETDEEFAATLGVCRSAGFSRTHSFPYSDRPGTKAAAMGRKCPPPVIRARKSRLEALAAGLALAYKAGFLGQTLPILTETSRDRSGRLCGYSPRYLRVLFDGGDELRGRVVPVAVTRAEPETLFGHVAEKP